ncbi:MAG: hypothetical protein R3C15_08420 [Thermoleophilia bacterium]
MSGAGGREAALAEIARLEAEEPEADEILRGALAALVRDAGFRGAAIWFVEGDELQLGPAAGAPVDLADPAPPAAAGDGLAVEVPFDGRRVAVLAVAPAGEEDASYLGRVAGLVAGACLVGWDTGGVAWDDLA